MIPTNISEAIAQIKQHPFYESDPEFASGAHFMVRVLTDNKREFQDGRFQLTPSHFINLNVKFYKGGEVSLNYQEDKEYNWFTLSPTQNDELRLTLCNSKTGILEKRELPEDKAAELIRSGIEYLYLSDGEDDKRCHELHV
ncbi:hypothetical protein [Gimesia chilikensis]|uniref:hypothetical protein n=1 Tax=Gimesia chilikensis TaxID=2605989 RepID=UPI00118A58F4|nr:hypothetical protein [Gimesia chilikensis]MCR9232208.1 hypothetical protein [bacterium]QDT84066.1 hypothetical protein MalM14_17180 [Gimesia chilikensis]